MITDSVAAFEHAKLSIRSELSTGVLSAGEADQLEGIAARIPGFCQRGHRSVSFGSFCGISSTGTRPLEILPKVDELAGPEECRGILISLLQRSRESRLFHQLQVGQQMRNAPLLDVFISAFFDEVSRLVRSGLMREYQPQEEDLRAVRGRLDVHRQFSVLADRRDVVACKFDELTADNGWNRFIKAGIRAVRDWIAGVDLDRRWLELMTAFEEVTDAPTEAADYSRLRIDRKASRYLPAAEWVRRILEVLSPSLRAGNHGAPGLLFDVNKLWEDAVASELNRTLGGSSYEVQMQATGTHLAAVEGSGARAIGLRPDLLIVKDGRVCALADSKWKRVDVSESGHILPKREDAFQMIAYAAAFRCEQLALIYPWHRGLAAVRETVLELPCIGDLRPRLTMVCLDPGDGRLEIRRGARGIPGLV